MKRLLTLALLLVSLCVQARTITTEVPSAKMGRAIPCIIVLPDHYDTRGEYPVIYLLHGHSGSEIDWPLVIKPDLGDIATRDSVIFVCPDGENSWYWDSPTNPQSQFETFVASELVAYIDKHYATCASREGRAITGFSMGGHGGFWLSIRHPEVFGAGGAISGGVDIRPFPNNWNMKDQLGPYKENAAQWNAHTVMTQLDRLDEAVRPALVMCCGYDDFFYRVNCKLHEELQLRQIPHDFYAQPGRHTGAYCRNAADYQFLFFNKYFHSAKN